MTKLTSEDTRDSSCTKDLVNLNDQLAVRDIPRILELGHGGGFKNRRITNGDNFLEQRRISQHPSRRPNLFLYHSQNRTTLETRSEEKRKKERKKNRKPRIGLDEMKSSLNKSEFFVDLNKGIDTSSKPKIPYHTKSGKSFRSTVRVVHPPVTSLFQTALGCILESSSLDP